MIAKKIIWSLIFYSFTYGISLYASSAIPAILAHMSKGKIEAPNQIKGPQATVCTNLDLLTHIIKMYILKYANNKSLPEVIAAVGHFARINTIFNEATIGAIYQHFNPRKPGELYIEKHGQLYIAIALRSPSTLRWIKKHKPHCGQEMLIPDKENCYSPLTYAVYNLSVFSYLEAKEAQALAAKDKNGYTPFISAVSHKAINVVDAIGQRVKQLGLINAVDKKGNTALMHAVNGGVVNLVEKVLALGALVNVKNTAGQDALNIALEKFTCSMARFMEKSDVEDIQDEAEANRKKYLTIIKLLLKHKADPNSRNSDGVLPIFSCVNHCIIDATEYEENIELFGELIKAGADCNQKDKYKQTVESLILQFDGFQSAYDFYKKR